MKIYAVTSGCYSDYCVEALFEKKENAELYCALHPSEDQDIEEWETEDDSLEKTDKPVLKEWLGCIHHDGDIKVDFIRYSIKSVFKAENVESRYCKPYQTIKFTTAKDKTEEQAKKILLDKLAALKYEQEMGLEFK